MHYKKKSTICRLTAITLNDLLYQRTTTIQQTKPKLKPKQRSNMRALPASCSEGCSASVGEVDDGNISSIETLGNYVCRAIFRCVFLLIGLLVGLD